MTSLVAITAAWMTATVPDVDTSVIAPAIVEASQELPIGGDVLTSISWLVAIGATETAFSQEKRGDRGNSRCFAQINIGRFKTLEGWTGEDLEQDPKKCALVALRRLDESFRVCRRNSRDTRSAVYCSGRCDSGHWAARRQYRLATWLLSLKPWIEEGT